LKKQNLDPIWNTPVGSQLPQSRGSPEMTLTFAHREFIIGVDLHVKVD